MGLSLKRTCPYCGTQNVAQTAMISWQTGKKERRALFQCGYCSEAIIYEWAIPVRNGISVDVMQYNGTGDAWELTTSRQWPSPPSTTAPTDTPASAARYFEQAVDSLNSSNFDASGMMFRKALESAIKVLEGNSNSKSLAARIRTLADQHIITPGLASWANEIRLGGNEAAHEDDPFTQNEAESLHHFTENFFRYAFTLPAAVERRSLPARGT